MGVFDYIHCDYPLPDNPEDVKDFQTKSFYPMMASYRIDENGDLFVKRFDTEETGEVMTIAGIDFPQTRKINLSWEPVPYDGTIEIHAFFDPHDNSVIYDSCCWLEYLVTFSDGNVVKIVPDAEHGKRF